MYYSLRNWGTTKEGSKMTIVIIGLGGLGSMVIKLTKALWHKVIAISKSVDKR